MSKVYCTLVTTDKYVEGALVVAHSLKSHGTQYPIAVLYTSDISASNVTRLSESFDHTHSIDSISNPDPSNLSLMSRPDLASTFSKLAHWSQTQYSTIVYLDADTLPLRAPDELFTLNVPFAAAPELGFPDCFNSGVMVLQPSLSTFSDLVAMAEKGETFDGGDQGLLNMYFGDKWERLSFVYNMEFYNFYHLYMPALNRVKEKWSVVHFIGKKKPWDWTEDGMKEYGDESGYGLLYKEMVGTWWERWEKATGRKRSEWNAEKTVNGSETG